MFEKAGIAMPLQYESWEHWIETAKKLTVYDNQGNVQVAGVNMRTHHVFDTFLHAVKSLGGEYFDPKTGQFTIDNEIGLQALTMLHSPQLELNIDNPQHPRMRESLLQGHAAMICDAPIIINLAKEEYPDINIGVSFYPPLVAGQEPWALITRGWAMGVNAQTTTPQKMEAAGEFFKYFFRDDVYLDFLIRYSGTPSTISMAEHDYFKTGPGSIFAPVLATAPNWVGIEYIGDIARYKAIFWRISQQISIGELGLKEALTMLEKELNFIASDTYLP